MSLLRRCTRNAANLCVCLSAIGTIVTCSGDSSAVTGIGAQPLYPNEPAGFTRIAETNDTISPLKVGGALGLLGAVLAGVVAEAGSSPSSLLTVVTGANLPVTFPHQTSAQKFIFEAGTPPGYQEPGSSGAGYYLWDNVGAGINGGPAANEYSAMYYSVYFSVYGNGSNIELTTSNLIKLHYLGGSFNNLNTSGGFGQFYIGLKCAHGSLNTGTSPYQCTQFNLGFTNQSGIGPTIDYDQNLNTSTHVVVGQVHHLELILTTGTDQGANGTANWWLDGTRIGSVSTIRFLDHTVTYAGAPGTAGFTTINFEPWWGGGGGANKSRDDALYFGHMYVSGIFLRSRQ